MWTYLSYVFFALLIVLLAGQVRRSNENSAKQQFAGQVLDLNTAARHLDAGGTTTLIAMMSPLATLRDTGPPSNVNALSSARDWLQGLSDAGFLKVGDFLADQVMLTTHVFTHPESGAAAAVYAMPKVASWYELMALSSDGQCLVITNAEVEQGEQPPWIETVRLPPATTPAAAYQTLLQSIDGRVVEPCTPENVTDTLDALYDRLAIWHFTRRDTKEERSQVAAGHQDEQIEQQRIAARNRLFSLQVDALLMEQWSMKPDVSADELKRIHDRMIVIHEHTPLETVIDLLGGESMPGGLGPLASLSHGDHVDPREAFRALQGTLESSQRFEHYATLEGEISGELWLRPEPRPESTA